MFDAVTEKMPIVDQRPARVRAIQRVVPAFPTQDGAGVRLLRSLGSRSLPDLDPFLMLDEIRSEDPTDWIAGFPSHPHRGFETVTYMLEGAMEHADSAGNHGVLEAGDVQWMTAGRGIVHSEMPLRRAGRLWGFQLWINLPRTHKMMPPRYQDIDREAIPVVALPGGGSVRLLAGEAWGHRGPVQGVITDPIFLDVTLQPGEETTLPAPRGTNALAYVITGHARFGGEAMRVPRSTLVSFQDGEGVHVRSAGDEELRLLLLAARPIGDPVVRYGPFVMNSSEEIEQAIRDFREGRLGR
jgi:redox-sensitive bicupin YhaK (pirin superfamily)